MATRTISLSADHSTMGGYDSGNLVDQHHPVGLASSGSGYTWRTFLKFAMDWTDVVQITSAVLYMRLTGSVGSHSNTGSAPRFVAALVTGTLTLAQGGSSEGVWSSSATPKRSTEPAVSGSFTMDTGAMARNYNTWYSWNITNIFERWAPSSVKMSGGSPGPGTANNGIRLISSNEASSTQTSEWSASESAYDPYIVFTYTTNVLPSAPTLVAPASGSTSSTQTPTFQFNHVDGDSDPASSYDLQVDVTTGNGITPDWASPIVNLSNQTDDLTNPISRLSPASLSRGSWYAWRARTADAEGDGPWMSTAWVYIAKQPTVTVTHPVSGGLARTYYTAASATTPKIRADWVYACADGHAQASAALRLYTAADSLLESASVAGTAVTKNLTTAVTNGTQYRFEMDVTCTAGVTSNIVTRFTTRVRWGRGAWYYDIGSVPVAWGTPVTTTNVPSNTSIVFEYGSTTSAAAEPTTWFSSFSSVTLRQFVWHRPTLMSWGASPTSPSISSITLKWSTTNFVPDFWTLASVASIDTATQVYGTQSLKHANTGAGGVKKSYQVVPVLPETTYTLSGRIKAEGNAEASIVVEESDGSAVIVASTEVNASQEWTAIAPISFFSDGRTEVRVNVWTDNANASTNAWFDALKLEASAVATPWTPGFVGGGVSIDAGGIQVDGTGGGVFRLKGSTGGSQDIVSLGAKGLLFGTDTNVYRGGAGELYLNSAANVILRTVSNVSSAGTYSAFLTNLSGDVAARSVFGRMGDVDQTGFALGPGSSARDIFAYRVGTAQWRIDGDGAGTTGLERIHLQGRTSLGLMISPTALTGNVDNWNPTGLATASFIRITSDATPRTITGIVAGNVGDLLILTNANSATAITLAHDVTSTAANRFFCPGNVNFTLNSRQTVMAIYDNGSSRWRVMD